MTDLTDYVDRWKGKTILVVGDVMFDGYTYVAHDGTCPEDDDAPIWGVIGRAVFPGGAANAAANAAALGAHVTVIGAVGSDAEGSALYNMLGHRAIDARLVVSRGQSTTAKARIYSGGQMVARLDDNQTDLEEVEDRQLAAEIRNAIFLLNPDAILLSDYSKGVLRPDGEVVAMLAEMNDHVDHIVLDPRRSLLGGEIPIDAITPNRREALMLGGPSGKRFFEAIPGLKAVIETRGAWGSVVRRPDQPDYFVRSVEVKDAHVCGAGDTFAATLTLARVAGAGWIDAARIANAASRVAVSRPGTVAPSVHGLKETLR